MKTTIRISFFGLALLYVTSLASGQSAMDCSQPANQLQPACNCVKYARGLTPIPSNIDLTYYSAKVSLINHSFPRVGAVAIHNIGDPKIGHVSVIRNVTVNSDGSLNVTISEGNNPPGRIRERTVRLFQNSRSEIVGFYDQAFPVGQQFQKIVRVSTVNISANVASPVTVFGSELPNDAQVIILGGWCDTFSKCVVQNNVLQARSSSQLTVPLKLNNPGVYTLYVYSPRNGKSSNGVQIHVN